MSAARQAIRVLPAPLETKSTPWSLQVLADMLLEWQERVRQRRALRALDDRLLKDIGVSRAEAEREAGKPFWRP